MSITDVAIKRTFCTNFYCAKVNRTFTAVGFFCGTLLISLTKKKTNKQTNKQKSGFSIAGAVSAGFSYFCKSWRLFSDVVNFA